MCEIVPFAGKSQPNVSLHLKKLVRAGVLSSRRDGKRIFYNKFSTGLASAASRPVA